jgi:hypothetical protein
MRLLMLRSAWGLGTALRDDGPLVLERLRMAGFHGLEASLDDIGKTYQHRQEFVRAARGMVSVLFSAAVWREWPRREGRKQ